MRHSEIHPMPIDEWLWITGKLGGELEPVDPRGYIEVDDDLPFEWDRQHSCRHGTLGGRDAACVGFGAAVVVCSAIVLWGALFAAVAAVVRGLV